MRRKSRSSMPGRASRENGDRSRILRARESDVENEQAPLVMWIKEISARLRAQTPSEGQTMSKQNIDEMWGH